ncbi:MAG TPA: protein kinase [Vicinamibacterales bacterium]|nr:protein kinase [Vicinamibacterales bacterium]
MAILPGSPIGPYSVLSAIGAGGMGEVYRAHDPRLGREVALKVLRRSLVDAADALDRLLREAMLASSLNHPNIVTIYDTGVVDEDRYVAMELVEGTTLRALAAQGLTVDRAVAIAKQVAEALAVAHAANVVHRDIKPDNVMVRPDGYVKLLDFGLARQHSAMATMGPTGPGTDPGMIMGTVGYMAPEQARGELAATEADIFAFGVVLYEVLSGKHPFKAPSQMATLHALVRDTPEPPSLLNGELPRALDQLVMEMLQKDPRLRPGAGEVLLRLGLVHDAAVSATLSAVNIAPRAAPSASAVVGRDAELTALFDEFARARHGRGRLVLVSAEAGAGKTTLVDAFIKAIEDGGEAVRVGRGRCSERLAGSEAYLPVLEALDSLQHHDQLGSISRIVRAVAPSWFAQIMPPAGHDSSAERLAAETASGSQERLKREIAALLEEAGRLHPVILWFDDVHWADPSTTDLISYLSRRMDGMRTMIIATLRPSDLAQARHAFLAVKLDLLAHGQCREIIPGPLDESAIGRYLSLQFAEHAFPGGFPALIHQRTEGHPLFVADLLRDLRRRHLIRQQDGRWIMASDLEGLEREMPPSVRSLLQRKVEALNGADRRLLGAASVHGIDFDTALLAAALEQDEEEVEDRLERLEREHALVRFVAEGEIGRTLTLHYRFAHQVYQNAFYESLRVTRRAALARAIADQLVARLTDRPCDCAAGIALLYETARDNVKAAEYFNQAAHAAARLYAHEESAQLAQRGLALLASEPPGPARSAAELSLQMTYGLAMKTGRGYAVPEVGAAYARARELCREVSDPARVVPVLIGMSAHHIVSGEIETSRDVALEMLDLFNRLGDPNLQMIGEWSLGAALFHLGELNVAHAHLERALALYDPAFHQPRVWETGIDPGVFCRSELSRTLLLRGYPDQGLAMALEAVAQARALEHPQPRAFALLFLTFVHLGRRDPAAVMRTYDELEELCLAHGIAQELQWAGPLRGRALVEMGDVDRGLREMEETLAAHTLTRSALLRPYYFVLYAGALLRGQRHDDAQRALDEATTVSNETGQVAYLSEHHRLQAELLIARGEATAGAVAYLRSLSTAIDQGASWLELRAARGYANHLAALGRNAEAREILAPVVQSIREGQETLDYVYAEALLRML